MFILISVLLTIGGCSLLPGKKKEEEEVPVTLVYWGLWETESVMREIIADYKKLRPNVTIEYTQRPFSEGIYKQQLLERLSDPDPRKSPDIMRIHNTWLPQFKDELAPIPTEVMTEAEYTQTFFDTAIRDFKSNGSIYAIPLEVDTLGLYYNKKLFQNEGLTIPPADWDSFIEYAKKLTKLDENKKIIQAGAAIGTSNNILHSGELLSLLMLQSNVDMVSEDKKQAIFDTSSNKQGEVVVDYYIGFVKQHQVWGSELPNSLDMFIQGKLGMMIAPSWRVFDILNAQPNFEFGTAPVPQISLGREVNLSTYWAEAVSKDSVNSKAAWEFVKFLSEKEQMKKLYDKESDIRAYGEPYSRKDLREEIKDAPYIGPFVQMGPTARSWYMGNDEVALKAFEDMITNVLSEKSTSTEIADAAQKVTLELQKL